MNALQYRQDYAVDPVAQRAFNAFLMELHGLDLTLWQERVGWDPNFVLFSFFDGDEVVASTGVYVVDMIVRGDWVKVAQFSSVGTRNAWRMRGLNAELTRRALSWIESQVCLGTFLFADDDATGFYAKQGFVERSEWMHVTQVQSSPLAGARVLNFDRDEDLIRRLVETRTPVSNILGVKSPKLELFHLIYENAGVLQYIQDFDLIVASEYSDQQLTIYDLIGAELPPWDEVEAFVITADTKSISFAVTPDRLRLKSVVAVEDHSSRLYVLPGEDFHTGQVIVPCTAHA